MYACVCAGGAECVKGSRWHMGERSAVAAAAAATIPSRPPTVCQFSRGGQVVDEVGAGDGSLQSAGR